MVFTDQKLQLKEMNPKFVSCAVKLSIYFMRYTGNLHLSLSQL